MPRDSITVVLYHTLQLSRSQSFLRYCKYVDAFRLYFKLVLSMFQSEAMTYDILLVSHTQESSTSKAYAGVYVFCCGSYNASCC